MEVDSNVILNEVDELLSKLDKLPEYVRIQALQKLSQKVLVPKPQGRGRRRGGRWGSRTRPSLRSGCLDVPEGPSEIDEGEKSNPAAEARVHMTEEKERSSSTRRRNVTTPAVVISGRRNTKKVDYRQLAEFGHDGEDQVEDEGIEGDGFDLLESCLQESGIKVGDNKKSAIEHRDAEVKVETGPGLEEDVVDEEEQEEEGLLEERKKGEYVYVVEALEELKMKQSRKKPAEAQYKCEECGKMYSTLSILKTHQVRHRPKSDLPFKCEECPFTAASKIELLRHMYKHTDKQLYVCEICGNTFSRDTTLREHIQYVHTKAQRLVCGMCDFSTHRRSTMRKHLQVHKGMPPEVACPVCGATFKSKRNLKAHLFSHAGAKPHSCDECGKKFILKNRLAAHKLQVHSPRTHNCPHCNKMFPTIHHLKRHVRIHTGEKPYACCFCSFSCNTQGNLIKHIRQVHDKINFSYKDYLRETGREEGVVKVDEGTMRELSEEGKQLAQRLMPTLGEVTGCHLTLDQLKEQVQKERDSKVAALQEQQARRKRRVLRKSSVGVKPSTYYSASDGKITLYALTGGGEGGVNGGDESSPIDPLMDVQIPVEGGLGGLQENQYLLTHTDDTGCVMIIPWDVSLTGESEDGDEDGAWGQQDLKVVKDNHGESIPVVTIKVPKQETITEPSMDSLNPRLKLSTSMKSERGKAKAQAVTDVVRMNNIVGSLNTLDIKGVTDGGMPTNILQSKNFVKPLPESIQVIASNEPVDDSVPSTSNFVLPEGYIMDNNGSVIQLTDNVLDTSLLLRQMGQTVGEAPEVTINKISSSVYSLMSQGSDGQDGEAFVITTHDNDDDDDGGGGGSGAGGSGSGGGGSGCIRGDDDGMVDVRGPPDVGVMGVDLQLGEEEDRQSSLVLIVNAEDLDGT